MGYSKKTKGAKKNSSSDAAGVLSGASEPATQLSTSPSAPPACIAATAVVQGENDEAATKSTEGPPEAIAVPVAVAAEVVSVIEEADDETFNEHHDSEEKTLAQHNVATRIDSMDVVPTSPSNRTNFHQMQDRNGAGWAVKRPISRPGRRLILPFYPRSCCGTGRGLTGTIREQIPSDLEERGVTPQFWREMIEKLDIEVQPGNPGIVETVAFYATIICLPLFCFRNGQYQKRLHHWLEDLNDELVPKGMFAKIQTSEHHSENYHEELSWLAIALSPEEVQLLQAEPVVYTPGCCISKMVPSRCQRVYCCWGEPRRV